MPSQQKPRAASPHRLIPPSPPVRMNDCTFVLIVEPSRKQNANGAKWEGAGARSAWLPGWKGPHLWPLLHSQRRALTQILKSALPSSAQESPMAPRGLEPSLHSSLCSGSPWLSSCLWLRPLAGIPTPGAQCCLNPYLDTRLLGGGFIQPTFTEPPLRDLGASGKQDTTL